MRNIFKLWQTTIMISIMVISTLTICYGKDPLDPKAQKKNALLTELSPVLNKYKIDVMHDWASNVPTRGNPVLAPLANYILKIDSTFTKRSANDERWAQEFYEANNGIVIGVKGQTAVEAGKFREVWDQTPSSQRVFISFAKEDAALAKNIKKELAAKGYKVFIYYEGEKEIIRSAEDIAYFMQTADNCLVIDTEIARKKYGVLAEALAHTRYVYHRKPDIVRVYGRTSCGRTQQVLEEFRKTNAKVHFIDIDKSSVAQEFVNRNSQYLEKELLPLVVINSKPMKFTALNFWEAIEKCERPKTL